jgi:hypothetical protein
MANLPACLRIKPQAAGNVPFGISKTRQVVVACASSRQLAGKNRTDELDAGHRGHDVGRRDAVFDRRGGFVVHEMMSGL